MNARKVFSDEQYFMNKSHICQALNVASHSGKYQMLNLYGYGSVSSRVDHQNFTALIAKEIARQLGVTEDLAELGGLGHDIGHPCFSHEGELAFEQLKGKPFNHEITCLRVLELLQLEKKIDTRIIDAWMSHCGEKHKRALKVDNEKDISSAKRLYQYGKGQSPGTIEAAIVNKSDPIAYLSVDTGDAVRINKEYWDYMPEELKKFLKGVNSSEEITSKLMKYYINDVVKASNVEEGIIAQSEEGHQFRVINRLFTERVSWDIKNKKVREQCTQMIVQVGSVLMNLQKSKEIYKYMDITPISKFIDFLNWVDYEKNGISGDEVDKVIDWFTFLPDRAARKVYDKIYDAKLIEGKKIGYEFK